MLPENNPDYDFKQKHTLLENGKVDTNTISHQKIRKRKMERTINMKLEERLEGAIGERGKFTGYT